MQGSRKAIVVIGMHRSGTSAMTRILSLAGASLPNTLMPAASGNEMGHWEPLNVAHFNDMLLAEADATWQSPFGPRRGRRNTLPFKKHLPAARNLIRDEFGDQSLIVMKDPRVTLLSDFWREALAEEGFEPYHVIMIRSPQEVAASLKKRDGLPLNKGYLLWATYMAHADMLTRDHRRIFCTYDNLLKNPYQLLDEIEDRFGFEFPRRSARSELEIEDFVRPTLRHHNNAEIPPLSVGLKPISDLADYLFDLAANKLPNGDVPSATQKWLSTLDVIMSPLLEDSQIRLESAVAQHAEQHSTSSQELAQNTSRFQALLLERDNALYAAQRDRDAADHRIAELTAALTDLQQAQADIQAAATATAAEFEAREAASAEQREAMARQAAEESARLRETTDHHERLSRDAEHALAVAISDHALAAAAMSDEAQAMQHAFDGELAQYRAQIANMTRELEEANTASTIEREMRQAESAAQSAIDSQKLAEYEAEITKLIAAANIHALAMTAATEDTQARQAVFESELAQAHARMHETMHALEEARLAAAVDRDTLQMELASQSTTGAQRIAQYQAEIARLNAERQVDATNLETAKQSLDHEQTLNNTANEEILDARAEYAALREQFDAQALMLDRHKRSLIGRIANFFDRS